ESITLSAEWIEGSNPVIPDDNTDLYITIGAGVIGILGILGFAVFHIPVSGIIGVLSLIACGAIYVLLVL
ncbi:MAG: hypothetical protein M0P07_04825, partial [Candidatus Methanomethylophilaceae archaeon]|nr:hypothetical protein [Candidatus Methanomethylophilaceae archaeon]MDY0247351.1 hypothetical protein [Methanosarcina mazei]